jgi:mono/diheme cytochrome c family protein
MFRVSCVLVGAVLLVPALARGQGTAAEGQKVFETQKCSLCHSVAGKGNPKGPLDGVAKKHSAADLKLWITQPAEMAKKHAATRKPPMKAFASLPPADLEALVVYLQSLK